MSELITGAKMAIVFCVPAAVVIAAWYWHDERRWRK